MGEKELKKSQRLKTNTEKSSKKAKKIL